MLIVLTKSILAKKIKIDTKSKFKIGTQMLKKKFRIYSMEVKLI